MSEKNKNDDDFLDSAIVDIATKDSDEHLKNQDNELIDPILSDKSNSKWQKIKLFIVDLWKNPKKRKITILVTFVVVLLVFVIPNTRYLVLNSVGIRSSSSIEIYDESTGQPLKNVNFSLRGVDATTDENGFAKLENLKLGTTDLVVKKRAFAEINRKVTLGWGSNPLGKDSLKPVGVQYSFIIKDFLSGKPIEKAEVVSNEYSAFSNAEGKAVLTIEEFDEENVDIKIKTNGYREESIALPDDNKEQKDILMVAGLKHFFVSKRSGTYDLYSIDVDSNNQKLLLEGTGSEREDLNLIPHPNRDVVALVSTRSGNRNSDGFLLSTLTIIDLTSGDVKTQEVATSERFWVTGWSDDYLAYVAIKGGPSGQTSDRNKLLTYNYTNGERKDLASSNYFNDVMLIGKSLYYAQSAAFLETKPNLAKVDVDGENKVIVFENESWGLLRTKYDSVMFNSANDWYEYDIKNNKVLAADGAPPNLNTKKFLDQPGNDSKLSLWVEKRDGKGTLVSFNKDTSEDKIITAQSGLTYPIRWVNDSTVVFRVNVGRETADYVISINGGETKKITDVTDTDNKESWYYY